MRTMLDRNVGFRLTASFARYRKPMEALQVRYFARREFQEKTLETSRFTTNFQLFSGFDNRSLGAVDASS